MNVDQTSLRDALSRGDPQEVLALIAAGSQHRWLEILIYIIGSLGYAGTRRYGETPIYRLDIQSLRMEPVIATGDAPGWIYGHRAAVIGPDAIRIWGGKVVNKTGDEESHNPNDEVFVLHVNEWRWHRV